MVLTLPTGPTYQSGNWRLISNAARFTSPISRVTQSVSRPGNMWAATLTLPPIRDPGLVADWAAFMAQIAGGEESFYLFPPALSLHDVSGDPVVDGEGQAGQTINLRGFDPGDTMRKGSFFCYDTSTFRMLHIVTATTSADAHGEMALPIRPGIRKAPADGAALTLDYPTCEMVLSQADATLLNLSDAVWHGHSLNVIESVRE